MLKFIQHPLLKILLLQEMVKNYKQIQPTYSSSWPFEKPNNRWSSMSTKMLHMNKSKKNIFQNLQHRIFLLKDAEKMLVETKFNYESTDNFLGRPICSG